MASDADSAVLTQLREIRATLAGHSARFDRIEARFALIDERFDQIDKRFDDLHSLVKDAQRLAMANQTDAPDLGAAYHGGGAAPAA